MITVNDILALPEIQIGEPSVVAGEAGLSNGVRWVHVSDLPDIGELLQGEELILTTGLGLGTTSDDYRKYIHNLSAGNVAGLVVELGRRFATLPVALLRAADRCALPVIQLQREVRFVDVTQAVHAYIVDRQLDQLRRSELIHQAFNELSVEEAPVEDILDRAAGLAGHAMVLENLSHQVLAVATYKQSLDDILNQWEHRSRAVRGQEVTSYDAVAGLMITDVGNRTETWGRLALVSDVEPDSLAKLVLERAATAIALRRRVEANRLSQELRTQASILSDMMNRPASSTAEVQLRSRALGVPLQNRSLIGFSVRFAEESSQRQPAQGQRRSEFVAKIARECRFPALVGAVEHEVRVLASLGPDMDEAQTVSRFSQRLRSESLLTHCDRVTVIGVGRTVRNVTEAARSLLEAAQVAEAAEAASNESPYHTISDVRLRGVLHILRSDPLLQQFAERELGALRKYDQYSGGNLIEVLRAYVENAGNKSVTAAVLHLSRPALYQRLERIGEILDVDLEDPESRLSLHAALILSDSSHKGMNGHG